ncbi:hypothetical protein I4U23_010828 [Adineta vaga]|nr:hypothetical protein I4U23_010828 [Adineta vaga]
MFDLGSSTIFILIISFYNIVLNSIQSDMTHNPTTETLSMIMKTIFLSSQQQQQHEQCSSISLFTKFDYLSQLRLSMNANISHQSIIPVFPVFNDQYEYYPLLSNIPGMLIKTSVNHMKLYQHSTECPVALNMFLKCQPVYWCFVPMTKKQAVIENAHITSTENQKLIQYQISDQLEIGQANNYLLRNPYLIRWCIDNLPSYRLDLFPTRYLDLYNATIVMALPETASDEMRHLIHALLVTYAEPKLNLTTITTDSDNNNSQNPWCQHLTHPRLLS